MVHIYTSWPCHVPYMNFYVTLRNEAGLFFKSSSVNITNWLKIQKPRVKKKLNHPFKKCTHVAS